MKRYTPSACRVNLVSPMYAGHLQALSVGAQDEAGLAGPLQDGPEEAEEEKPGEELVQVRGQGERGETAGVQSPNTTVLQLWEILQDLVPIHNQANTRPVSPIQMQLYLFFRLLRLTCQQIC